jgi:allophanate hydrolase subunit 1
MPFLPHTETLFAQMDSLLQQLTPEAYQQPLPVLHGSSIGQHLRHVIEFFEELEKGYESGIIDYDQRQRNLIIETDKAYADAYLRRLLSTLNKKDKSLELVVSYLPDAAQSINIPTTYYREWVYNIEHTIHHMALIKTGVHQLEGVALPSAFGIAVSTQRAQNKCAQ